MEGPEYPAPVEHTIELRDWLAGQALIGLCASVQNFVARPPVAASLAYELADAMLAERAKP